MAIDRVHLYHHLLYFLLV